MLWLIVGLVTFLGIHSVSIFAPAWRDAMVARSRARAACFDWNRSAGQLLALYDEALSQPARSRT